MATKKPKIIIQDAPVEGNFTREHVRAAVKAVRNPKQNVDPGRPISRPMATVKQGAGWGKMLTKEELLGLIDRIHKKQEEEKMSKLSDTLAKALAKKKGVQHVDGSDAGTTVEKKTKGKTSAPTSKKPPTRSAGRGR